MDKQRLTEAAEFLENLVIPPYQKFDMKSWRSGTSFCAIGWIVQRSPTAARDEFRPGIFGEPCYKNHHYNWSAVKSYYDITEDAANRLFNDSSCYKPSDVAKKIREELSHVG